MTVDKDKKGRRDPEPAAGRDEAPARTRNNRPAAPEVGQALRSVYQRTIDEDIPPEMLDLLGKLG